MQDFHASLPGAILHQRKCLINAVIGNLPSSSVGLNQT